MKKKNILSILIALVFSVSSLQIMQNIRIKDKAAHIALGCAVGAYETYDENGGLSAALWTGSGIFIVGAHSIAGSSAAITIAGIACPPAAIATGLAL